jgi:branched-chain amino acid transport system substrate-binding protein
VMKSGKPLTAPNVRDAIQVLKIDTLQGPVSFASNGDINNKIVSVFQFEENKKFPVSDYTKQYKYIGVAPQS